MVTPINGGRTIFDGGVTRLVDSLLAGGVDGIFVMGTTAKAPSVPRDYRLRQIVKQTVAHVKR